MNPPFIFKLSPLSHAHIIDRHKLGRFRVVEESDRALVGAAVTGRPTADRFIGVRHGLGDHMDEA